MISMIEKIHRFVLTNCDEPLKFMSGELQRHWDVFYDGEFIEEFEKKLDAAICCAYSRKTLAVCEIVYVTN